jgi:hypothetical protein
MDAPLQLVFRDILRPYIFQADACCVVESCAGEPGCLVRRRGVDGTGKGDAAGLEKRVSVIPVVQEELTMRLRFMTVPKESLHATFSLARANALHHSL